MRMFGLVLCAALIGCGAAGAADAPSAAPAPPVSASPASAPPASALTTIDITNFAFSPKELVIEKGATVRWTNHDGEPHTVVSSDDPKAFKSRPMDDGDSYAFTFTEAGTFAYFCSVHPHMRGKIVVK